MSLIKSLVATAIVAATAISAAAIPDTVNPDGSAYRIMFYSEPWCKGHNEYHQERGFAHSNGACLPIKNKDGAPVTEIPSAFVNNPGYTVNFYADPTCETHIKTRIGEAPEMQLHGQRLTGHCDTAVAADGWTTGIPGGSYSYFTVTKNEEEEEA